MPSRHPRSAIGMRAHNPLDLAVRKLGREFIEGKLHLQRLS